MLKVWLVSLFLQAYMSSQPLRLLPLAINDWATGHELPDIVAGRLFSGHILLKVENRGNAPLSGVALHVQGSNILQATTGVPVGLQPGQRSSLHAPLAQIAGTSVVAAQCPLQVKLHIEVNGTVAAKREHRLGCRAIHDRFSFVYIDVDGSPQLAAAKFPSSCPEQGCAVLLSTHGMDVTAQRQADCYRPLPGAWVLAPHGRGTHGFNWQGPGHWSALRALDSLAERAGLWQTQTEADAETANDVVRVANPPRVIFAGHSNGGFGAWFFGTHYPDMALGVAPLSGMATIGTTQVPRPAGLPDRLWELVDSSVEEYRGDGLASNLIGASHRTQLHLCTCSPHQSYTYKPVLCSISPLPDLVHRSAATPKDMF